jgi:hypothetical protein
VWYNVGMMKPFVELGGRAVDGGTLLAAGDADGQVSLITLRLGEYEHAREATDAALAGGRVMRVVHTDKHPDFEVPLPPFATERITLQEWRLDSHDHSMVIWAGYGSQSKTWVVRDGGLLV